MTLLDTGSDIVLGSSHANGFGQTQTTRLDFSHCDELQDFFTRLDRDSRCRRFGQAAADDLLRKHAIRALREASCVVGVFAGQTLRGVLELYSCAPTPVLEGGIVVEQAWRRRGLATALLRTGLGLACDGEESSIRLIFTRDNWPMRKLANNANARFDMIFDEVYADIPISAARLLS